jgi:hypothetical protein
LLSALKQTINRFEHSDSMESISDESNPYQSPASDKPNAETAVAKLTRAQFAIRCAKLGAKVWLVLLGTMTVVGVLAWAGWILLVSIRKGVSPVDVLSGDLGGKWIDLALGAAALIAQILVGALICGAVGWAIGFLAYPLRKK